MRHFFLLGAAKAGTTSLNYYLGQHAGVLLSTPKEPVFFEAEYERGLEHYRRKYFPGAAADEARLLCDSRPGHLHLPFVAERIARSVPDARMVVLLRDPAQRAYSHWQMRRMKGREDLDFPAAIAASLDDRRTYAALDGPGGAEAWRALLEPGSGESRARLYVQVGWYADHLARYFRYFPREQFLVLDFEQLKRQPAAAFDLACRFLGLPPPSGAVDFSVRNSAEQRRDNVRLPPAARALGRLAPAGLRALLKRALPGAATPQPASGMDVQTQALLRAHYAERNAGLPSLLAGTYGRPQGAELGLSFGP